MIALLAPESTRVVNHLTGEYYRLVPCNLITPTSDRVAEVAAICNEPLVYKRLFRRVMDGLPYPSEKATEWFSWASDGWREQTHFCFAVLTGAGKIAAACDIKSANPDGAEIGYWCSMHEAEIMTNAVIAMCELARQSGFRSLMAGARHGNFRSRAVLSRAGFWLDSNRRTADRDYFYLTLADEFSIS